MLKIRDLMEVPALYELMTAPEVYPFVVQKLQPWMNFTFQPNRQ